MPELVEIHMRHRLAKAFGHTVKPIGPHRVRSRQPFGLRIEPDHMVRAGKHDARLPMCARRLIKVIHPLNIRVEDRAKGFLGRNAAEMHDTIAARDQPHHRRLVAQIAGHQLFVRRGLAQIGHIRQPHHLRHRREKLAHHAPQPPRRAGNQQTFHQVILSS
ncbi:hypothetical protein GALL_529700 [mine drainage metagenome]|uniref:Uncharacterized protein n=1 Tax=mine drainage metagenome TaxID=410659 RepID=A0A1J5PCC1_9ZZZZ